MDPFLGAISRLLVQILEILQADKERVVVRWGDDWPRPAGWLGWLGQVLYLGAGVQGYLAHKKTSPPRTLQ